MNQDDIKLRARTTLAKVLKVPVESIADDAYQIQFANWDSLKHMNVVLALENEFDLEFDDSELPTLTSLETIISAIEKRSQ